MHTIVTPTKKQVFSQSKILVVYSEQDDLNDFATALKLLDYNYLVTSEAILALSLAQQEQPDLILLDLQLPRIGGIELLRTLRSDWLTRHIPVIAIASSATIKSQKIVLEGEFDGYLSKPYLLEDLHRAICIHLPCRSIG